jgi:hypothetical protein
VACCLALLAATSCSLGSSEAGDPVAVDVAEADNDRPGAQSADHNVEVWSQLADLLANADEAEGFTSLAEMVRRADAVVIGRVTEVREGRVVRTGVGVPALPFAEFVVEPTEMLGPGPETQDDGSILVEVPFEPRSPELDAAIDAAIDDKALDPEAADAAYAAAVDDQAIAKAFADYYDGAIDFTIGEMNANPPSALSLFALRRQSLDIEHLPAGAYRLVNGSGVIANVDEVATLPLRLDPREDLLADEVLDRAFDEVVAAARAARGR